MRMFKIGLLVLSLLVVGVFAAHAQEVPKPSFTDGRLNAYDTAAPLAVYCKFDYPNPRDPNAGVLDEIEVWGYRGTAIQQVLRVNAETIDEVGVDQGEDQLIAENAGYALYRRADGGFYVTGGGYRFDWERGDQGC